MNCYNKNKTKEETYKFTKVKKKNPYISFQIQIVCVYKINDRVQSPLKRKNSIIGEQILQYLLNFCEAKKELGNEIVEICTIQ